MSCEEYLHNFSRIMAEIHAKSPPPVATIDVVIKNCLYKIGLPILCVFGILGNILNIIILTRKQLKRSMDRMEKSVHLGLVALAVSDLLFCVAAMPLGFTSRSKITYTEMDAIHMLYYMAYNQPFINMFMLSSTWLTVVMATGRYLAICHPLHARGLVGLKATKVAIFCIFLFSFLFNLPPFWEKTILESQCASNCKCYQSIPINSTALISNIIFSYNILWTIIGVFLPLVLLAFCNFCLIRALRESNRMRRMYRANQPKGQGSGHRLTPTLIAIVLMFIILVMPSEILKFLKTYILKSKHNYQYIIYQTASIITNFFQAINFTINFVLYCVINVHFRETVKEFLCCFHKKKEMFKGNNQTTIVLNMSENDIDMDTCTYDPKYV